MGIFNDIATKYSYNPQAAQQQQQKMRSNPWAQQTNPAANAQSLRFTPDAKYTGVGGGDSPYASYKTNIGGKDYYYSPQETFGAFNRWSSAAWDPEKAKSLGGVEFNRHTGANTGMGGQPAYEKGFLFENAPDVNQMNWHAGAGESFRDYLEQSLAPTLAMTVAAPMAGAYATGSALPGGIGTIGGGSGGLTATSGGGSMATTSSTPGGAMIGGGKAASPYAVTSPTVNVAGASGGAQGLTMPTLSGASYTPGAIGQVGTGSGGLGLTAPANAASMLGTGSSGGLSSLANLFGDGAGVLGSNISGAQAGMLGLAGTDMYMRQQQQDELRSLMERASREANPLKQEERLPYQKMLSDYMTGGQDITSQPIVKSELDFLQRQAQAQMAKAGMTGSGNAGNIMTDYMLEGLNRTSQPYLNYLAGLGGFNQGVGNSGQIMATLGSQASGAPFQGMNSLGSALGSLMYNERPWWASANNAQIQMQGRGPTTQGVY